ncbi:MAG: YihY/virulence factor BrkB family protein [Thermomicrobium sp.]|nr:YihY/virulence factor BrkB family protein [Thermomicrobium sp.]
MRATIVDAIETVERLARQSALWSAFERFRQRDGVLYAAAIAYTALLSLGPFLLALATLAGLLLQGAIEPRTIVDWLALQFPQAVALTPILLPLLERQAAAANGLLVLGSLLRTVWAASLLGITLRHSFQTVAAPTAPVSPLRERLAGVTATLVALFGAVAWLGLLVFIGGLLVQLPFHWRVALGLLSSGVVFVALYSFLLPGPRISTAAVLSSSLLAAAAWEIAKWVLTLIAQSVSRSSEVYGVLGGLVALLVGAHVAAMITLYGATLAFTLAERRFRRAEHRT